MALWAADIALNIYGEFSPLTPITLVGVFPVDLDTVFEIGV
jgi:hypothetical protein